MANRKSDLPIFLGRFAGFGDLTVRVDELDKYGFIAHIPNTDLMDAGLDYGQMFITKDPLLPTSQSLLWDIHPGTNRLEVRTLNGFDVPGPIATAEVIAQDKGASRP